MKTILLVSIQRHDLSGRRMDRGFALVVTLSLMILLTVVAVGLLSLSAVSLRSSSQVAAQAEAQANARLGLMIAIGELQKQLGPDQRVSMTADQRMMPAGDGGETSAAVGNRHWTGVFESWPASSNTRPSPLFRSWLVSGESGRISQLAAPDTMLSAAEAIELVGAGTMGASSKGQVKAPLVSIKPAATATGRMAWWVGDQGVKAALATQPASRESTLGVLRNNLQAAPRNATELAAADGKKPFSGIAPDDARTQFVTSWGQAAFLASDIAAARPLFHDLTDSASGLMTNVRAGGFRKDLSMKMENFTGPPDLSNPANVLYYVQGEEGINFQELWAFYHLYKQLQYRGGGSYTTGGTIPAGAPFLRTSDTLDGVASDDWNRFKHPITISYQVVLSFEMAPDPSDPNRNLLWLNFDPIVTLWNPLDVAVDIPPSDGARCYMYVYWVFPYDINVRINGQPELKCPLLETVSNKGDANILRLNVGQVERLTLKPGEVVKMAQTGNTVPYNTPGNGLGGFGGLNGRKGFNYGGGIRVPLRDLAGNPVGIQSSDSIAYSATPNNLAAGGSGNSKRWSLNHNSVVLGSPWGTNIHIGKVSVDHWAGYSRARVAETRSRSTSIPNPLDIKANEPRKYDEVYPRIEGARNTRTLIASEILGRKAPFLVHSYNIKTEIENKRGSRSFARFNPKALDVNFYDLSAAERDMMPYEAAVTPLTSWLNAPLDQSTDGRGFFGSSLASEFGSNFVNTHNVPRQPIVSLAAFQHSFANGFNRLRASQPTGTTEHAMALLPLLPQISHAIGNSLASSLIPSDRTEGSLPGNPHPLADHSYLANRALWDDWFLSGITPQPSPAFPQFRDQKTVATEFLSGQKPLPVARYMPVPGGQDASQLVASFFSRSVPTDAAINNIASHLRVDGMFNVNSTSVEAWKTVLGSLKDRQIVVRDESGAESIAAKDANTPVAGVGSPRNVITSDNSGMSRDQWYGRRSLSDDEIDGLARAIVKEVRKRGPFLSLADFVNRRVGTDKSLAKSGAIQSALDSGEVEINRKQNTGRAVSDGAANRFSFSEAEKGPMAYGAPSIVKQGDILTPIAPILSARSDSFIIRSYGESTDNSGKILARAWCEAVVERDREYIDAADKAETPPATLTIAANGVFGRRFNIVSFRWLNANEV